MHKEILTSSQAALLPIVKAFSKNFVLVGGTAVALQIGHRRSIDFDLFSLKPFSNGAIREKIKKRGFKINEVLVDKRGELTLIVSGVKMTFFHYPFKFRANENFDAVIKMPNLATLAALKAHALGRRAKWKDYVDLYFILKDHYAVGEIAKTGAKIFGDEFNERLFRVQLAYHEDINNDEKLEFLPGFNVSESVIKKTLTDLSIA